MLLPTKGIEPDRALLKIGADLLELLDQPATVSGLWERFCRSNRKQHGPTITFDWFALTLAMLFALRAIECDRQGLLRRGSVSP